MHGLILRAIQLFVTDIYGSARWAEVVKEGRFEFDEIEAMLDYDVATGLRLLDTLARVLDRPHSDIYEDIGTYLVSHPNTEALRRLLRFGGVTFTDFLHSLDDLPERARLAVPNLQLPEIRLRERSASHFSVTCQSDIGGYGHVLLGILRTMADDYGALAFLEHRGGGLGSETLSITVLEDTFSEGRSFELGAMVS
jgi:hypothetical protein